MKNNFLFVFAIIALAILSLVFFYFNFLLRKELALLYSEPKENQEIKKEIVNVLDLIISKILLSKDELDLNEKIFIDNKIKSLNDITIYNKWSAFLNSVSEDETQQNFKILLKTLVDKLK